MTVLKQLCFFLALIALALVFGACEGIDVDNPRTTCEPACASSQTCYQGKCCTPNCDRPDGTQKNCGSDGCGGICGSCPKELECAVDGVFKPMTSGTPTPQP